ncbi:MAG: RNA polymerase sigma factor [Desulfobacteraceae bacterium]|nr:MAG: RNA polymerase sigma factor [Desulfobacteraceae bacterium]
MKPPMVKKDAAGEFDNQDSLIDLVKRCQDGDSNAMETVYNHYKSPLFNLAYRFAKNYAASKDLLQDIFINIFSHIDGLRTPEAFNGWLYRVAINSCISFVRQKRKVHEVSLDEIENTICAEDVHSPMRQQLEEAVGTLPIKQKTVFLLHDVQGFTHAEIAGMTRLTEGTSKSQLFKARMKIRNYLRSKL